MSNETRVLSHPAHLRIKWFKGSLALLTADSPSPVPKLHQTKLWYQGASKHGQLPLGLSAFTKPQKSSHMNKDVTKVRFSSRVKTRKLLPHFIHLSAFLPLFLIWVNKEPTSKISNVFLSMLLGFLPCHYRLPTTVGA